MARKNAENVNTSPNDAPPETEEKTFGAEDIANMSDDEFEKYLDELSLPDEEGDGEATEDIEEGGEEENPEPEEVDGEAMADDNTSDREPFRVFDSEEEYEKEVQKRIDEALSKKGNEKPKSLKKLEKIAGKLYGDSEDPISTVADELEKQYADSEGIDISDLQKKMADEEDLKAFRKEKSEKEKAESDRDSIIKKWNEEAELICHIDKDFDFKKALADKDFKNALLEGKSVHEAYKILKDSEESKHQKEKKPSKSEIIDQNGQSPRKGTGEGKMNPASLSDKDFKKYIENIKNS